MEADIVVGEVGDLARNGGVCMPRNLRVAVVLFPVLCCDLVVTVIFFFVCSFVLFNS